MTEKKLTIREGGFYRTRDGRKVGPMSDVSDRTAYFHDRHDGESCCYVDGKIKFDRSECGGDLVAEWRDEGTLRDLDVKPGDVVECVTSKTSATAPGSHYTIAVCPLDGDPRSFLDDEGEWCEDTTGYTFRLVSRAPATDTDAATIQRVMEASAPATDLTAITTPFGLLPPETQAALKAHDGPVEVFRSHGWALVKTPYWVDEYAYRAAPQPKVETVTNREMYLTARGCVASNAKLDGAIPVTITYTTTNGVIDPASYRVEARG